MQQAAVEQATVDRILSDLFRPADGEIAGLCKIYRTGVGQLLLITRSARHATRLRHRQPSFEAALRRSGLEFETLKIRVLPDVPLKPGYRQNRVSVKADSARSVTDLADSLPAGELREALEKLGATLNSRNSSEPPGDR